ncbi:MAG: hypothetical protein ACYC9Q_08160 [Bacillota bacterium]
MTVLAQHGYGKSDKIQTALREGVLGGLVLSPKDEEPSKMYDYIDLLRGEFGGNIAILFDPQFYATTIPSCRDGYLTGYPYYQPGLTRGRFISQSDIHQYALNALKYQANLNLSGLMSPAILFQDFRDPWSQIALSMLRESIDVHASLSGAPPLYLSIVVDENAFKNRDALDEFLDLVSAWDFAGVYLVVRRNDPNYPAFFEESVLANLMYLVYVLGKVNEVEVVCGYTDLAGILLRAVGARAIASGWFNSLRQFSLNRFLPATGGKQPRPRYTSAQLLNSILVVPELAAIHTLGMLPSVLSGTSRDSVMSGSNPANASWTPSTSCLHHWEVLSSQTRRFASQESISANLDLLRNTINQAIGLYRVLSAAGVPFEAATGPRDLEVWLRAVAAFRAEVNV